jgi:hypothetical protein
VPLCLFLDSLIIPFPQLVCDIILFCKCFFDRLVLYLPCLRWRSLMYWPFPLTTPRVVLFSLDYPWLFMVSSYVSDVREIENLEIHSAPVDFLHFFCSQILVGEDFNECNIAFPSSERFPCSHVFYCGITLLQESPAFRDPVRCQDILFVLVKVTAHDFFFHAEQSQISESLDGAPPQRCHHGVFSHC